MVRLAECNNLIRYLHVDEMPRNKLTQDICAYICVTRSLVLLFRHAGSQHIIGPRSGSAATGGPVFFFFNVKINGYNERNE